MFEILPAIHTASVDVLPRAKLASPGRRIGKRSAYSRDTEVSKIDCWSGKCQKEFTKDREARGVGSRGVLRRGQYRIVRRLQVSPWGKAVFLSFKR